VTEQIARSQPVLEATPGFKQMRSRMLDTLTSERRIPTVGKRGNHLYNF
jgi:prolyl oligopeptidase PreP (S9A serine peptidase family)